VTTTAALFFLRLIQKNINAMPAKTTTTTGTAMAACIPGEDIPLLACFCRSFVALLAALEAKALGELVVPDNILVLVAVSVTD